MHGDGCGETRHVAQGSNTSQPEKRADGDEHGRGLRHRVGLGFPAQEGEQSRQACKSQPASQGTRDGERLELTWNKGRQGAGDDDEDRISRRVGLVMSDVEVPDTERKIDGIDVLERLGKVPEVRPDNERYQRTGSELLGRPHAGLSSNPSLRLPVR